MFTIIQFSPTGNAAYISKQIAKELIKSLKSSEEGQTKVANQNCIKLLTLEKTAPLSIQKDIHLVLVFAIHGFNVPRTVKRFIHQLPGDLFNYVSLIGVGCNTSWVNDGATLQIRKQLLKKGYKLNVDTVVAMPLTLIMRFSHELIKKQLLQAKFDIPIISSNIVSCNSTIKKVAIKSRFISLLGRVESMASRFFGLELHANKSCTRCGQCLRECPEKNIVKTEKGDIRFGFRCLMCMRCIYNCPERAISPRISKFIPISKGYKLQEVLLNSEHYKD